MSLKAGPNGHKAFNSGLRLLLYDATDDARFLELGREQTLTQMASHITHVGVHDHGFNQVSTYGNLWRLMLEGRFKANPHEQQLYELALRASGAVQAARWTDTADGDGFIYSFNGPHSLLQRHHPVTTILGHGLATGPRLWTENDRRDFVARTTASSTPARQPSTTSIMARAATCTTSGGRVAHESLFNTNDGRYRCPSTQQGYSPFSTWTRGLAWIMVGYPEQLEFLQTVPEEAWQECGGRDSIQAELLRAARAACDFYLQNTPICGVPYWDTGAPGLAHLGAYLDRPADPANDLEPVDSSAAAIAAQGLLRLGHYLQRRNLEQEAGHRYWQAGLTVLAPSVE